MAAPPAASAAGGVKKLAIFPALYGGRFGRRLEKSHEKRTGLVKKLVGNRLSGKVEIVREFASTRGTGPETDVAILKNSWGSGSPKVPNEAFIHNFAKSLGLDLVLIFKITMPERGQGQYKIYMLDIANSRTYTRGGDWARKVGPGIRKALKGLFKDYQRGR
ncbi:MAG: hypothetical protein O7A69_15655, partial [SAR324 cluster bacterium]|nr:hypothetical protein [SAR324 cluster bacterium]